FLILEERAEGDAAIGGLENAASRRADIEGVRIFYDAFDGCHTATHIGRADRAPAKISDGIGFSRSWRGRTSAPHAQRHEHRNEQVDKSQFFHVNLQMGM